MWPVLPASWWWERVRGLQGRMVFSLKSCFPLRGVCLGERPLTPSPQLHDAQVPSGFHLLGWSCLAQLSRPPLNHCQGKDPGLGSQSGHPATPPSCGGWGAGPEAARGPRRPLPRSPASSHKPLLETSWCLCLRSDSTLEEFLDKASGFQPPQKYP